MTRETWEFINSFAPWLSAIGSLAAAVVALYLSWNTRRVRVKVLIKRSYYFNDSHGRAFSVSPELVASGQVPQVSRPAIQIDVSNHGSRKVKIGNVYLVYWSSKEKKKKNFIMIPPAGVSLPVTLDEGDEQNFIYPEEVLLDKQKAHWRGVFAECKWFWTFKVGAYTTTGKHFESRVPKKLLNHMKVETANDS